MKFQTFSIIVGDMHCNASCPFCVSKMTPKQGIEKQPRIMPYSVIKEALSRYRNLDKACDLAQRCGVTTALLTGKGEPTLHLDRITQYLRFVGKCFPLVELQTNGIILDTRYDELKNNSYLDEWYKSGLNTISLSIIHYKNKRNQELCGYPSDFNLKRLIHRLHELHFTVRLSCLFIKDYIDTWEEVNNLIDFAKQNNVEQLTLRTLERPKNTDCKNVSQWIKNNRIEAKNIVEIDYQLETYATKLLNLVHGATVYDYKGQNVCLTHALTHTPNPDEIRQLIYFPDGHLRYDWQYEGAILL